MNKRTRAALLAAATTALVAGTAATAGAANATTPSSTPAHQPGHSHYSPTVGTVFAQTDGLTGNAVVAYDRLADGTLRQAGTYATGGVGVQLGGSVVDHTASEGSLARDGSSLFAVNAGSGTVTSFGVIGDHLVRRQVVSSGGNAPVSIATHGDRVFVLNARDGGSIQGYLNVGGYLVKVPSWHRDLGLNPNATPEFTSTPAQVSFTPDGSKLIVSTKGGSSSFDVFSVGIAGISATPVVTAEPGDVPFGFGFDARGHIVASLAGPNAVGTFEVRPDGSVVSIDQVATGQAATCWITVDGDHVFASNAGSGTVTGYTVGSDGSLTAAGVTATDKGTVDSAATPDGKFLYVQTGATGTIDEFAVAHDGSLTKVGSVVVPGGVGGEGISAF